MAQDETIALFARIKMAAGERVLLTNLEITHWNFMNKVFYQTNFKNFPLLVILLFFVILNPVRADEKLPITPFMSKLRDQTFGVVLDYCRNQSPGNMEILDRKYSQFSKKFDARVLALNFPGYSDAIFSIDSAAGVEVLKNVHDALLAKARQSPAKDYCESFAGSLGEPISVDKIIAMLQKMLPRFDLTVRTPVVAVASTASVATNGREPGGMVAEAKKINSETCQKPAYPEASRRKSEEGTVGLKFLVDEDGTVIDGKIMKSSGFRLLDEAAIVGLGKCKFRPAINNGKPEKAWIQINYQWSLQ